MKLVHEITEEGEENIPDSEMQLAFVKFGYMLALYIPPLRDVDLEKRCMREPG